MASTATPIDDGQAYELEGVKLWTTNGVVADLLVVMARVPLMKNTEGNPAPLSSRLIRPGSPWSGATSSWDCVASKTA